MRLRHRARTAAVLVCASSLLLATPALSNAATAVRVLPHSGVLYVGTAVEDGLSAGPVSVRVGPDGTTLVSLLGGHFHGDLCAPATPMYAGPGGIDPTVVTIGADGKFAGTMVSTALDGARVASNLHGRFSPDAATASGTLTYAVTPASGALPCTVTATLALHKAPPTPTGKVTPPRSRVTYRAISHQGWAATVVTGPGAKAKVSVAAWDVCHYVALTSAHFLYPEHIAATTTVAHGRFSIALAYTGGSGSVHAAITGAFVGTGHHLAGALHIRRTGTIDGNAFSCDSQRVLLSAP